MNKNFIRIISGRFKGQKVLSPPSQKTHPMGSREKIALFNMILPYIEGSRVLDAYAGSGALGFEALSLGAKQVVFVEKDRKTAHTIRETKNLLGLDEEAVILNQSVKTLETTELFEIILIDPPYDQFNPEEFIGLIKFVADGGLVVLSHPTEEPPVLGGFRLSKTRSYARAHISIYKKGS